MRHEKVVIVISLVIMVVLIRSGRREEVGPLQLAQMGPDPMAEELLSPEQQKLLFEVLDAMQSEEQPAAGEAEPARRQAEIATDQDVHVAEPAEVAPEPPTVTAKAAPEPPPALKEPLSIAINGPVDALVGDQVFLTTETRGDVTSFTWSIDPPVKGLVVRDGGRSAVFSNRAAQAYTVLVSVAGNDGYSAHDFLSFELMERIPDTTIKASDIGKAPAELDVDTRMRGWTLEVESLTKQTDAAVIAGAFRSVANRLRDGGVANGKNPLDQVRIEAELGLGPDRYAAWNKPRGWFNDVEDFLTERFDRGEVVDNLQFANTFLTLAQLLEQAAARQ